MEELKEKGQYVQTGKKTRGEYYLIVSRSGFTPACLREMESEGVLYMGLDSGQQRLEALASHPPSPKYGRTKKRTIKSASMP